jgi:hypothetical protein
VIAALLGLAASASEARPRPPCGTRADGAERLLAHHVHDRQRAPLRARSASPDDSVRGQVAVLHDRGDLVARRNPFDLERAAVRFVANAAGGYDAVPLALGLEPEGAPLAVPTGGVAALELPFPFPFFGRAHARVYVHADGALTLSEPGRADPDLSQFLAGPPKIAAFLAPLDPSRAGRIAVRSGSDRVTVSWSDVPTAGQVNRNSFQIALHPTGAIDLVYGEVEGREALAGVSPGAGAGLTAADLSVGRPGGSRDALAERFAESDRLDLVATARRFLSVHPDVFEQLVVYATRPLNPFPGTLAFELNLRHDVRGIGLEGADLHAAYGSAGALASVVYMDTVDTYLDADAYEILGHEVGHRWLARLPIRGPDGGTSAALLGRGSVHWSFFLHSEGSVMEGNDIRELGGGRFETVGLARGFSALDLYAMGLLAPAEVPRFFYVEDPDDFRPNRGYKSTSGPEGGVSFTGTRREVGVEDVIAVLGPRQPPAGQAPTTLRQAFILVADDQAPATEARAAAAERIRAGFPAWYREATRGRGAADSTLR